MARLRGDLEIVRHLLSAARAQSGEVGIITGMSTVHKVFMKNDMVKNQETLH